MDDQALSSVIERVLWLIHDPKTTTDSVYEREAAHRLLMAAADAWLMVVPGPNTGHPVNTVFILPAKIGVVVTDRLISEIGCSYELKRLDLDLVDMFVCDIQRREAAGVVELDGDLVVADYRVYLRLTEAEVRQLMPTAPRKSDPSPDD